MKNDLEYDKFRDNLKIIIKEEVDNILKQNSL